MCWEKMTLFGVHTKYQKDFDKFIFKIHFLLAWLELFCTDYTKPACITQRLTTKNVGKVRGVQVLVFWELKLNCFGIWSCIFTGFCKEKGYSEAELTLPSVRPQEVLRWMKSLTQRHNIETLCCVLYILHLRNRTGSVSWTSRTASSDTCIESHGCHTHCPVSTVVRSVLCHGRDCQWWF